MESKHRPRVNDLGWVAFRRVEVALERHALRVHKAARKFSHDEIFSTILVATRILDARHAPYPLEQVDLIMADARISEDLSDAGEGGLVPI